MNRDVAIKKVSVTGAPYAVVGDSFRVDKPQLWSPTSYVPLGNNYPYDLHPDGKRLALAAAEDQRRDGEFGHLVILLSGHLIGRLMC